MHKVLMEYGSMKITFLIHSCHNMGISKQKLRKLVDIGRGRYWDIENRPEEKNAKFIIPKSVF
ncbi:MAG: hypothetical protein ACYSTS_12885 [Planctomycetota bacterium]